MKKVALYFGSFNPIHIGHLALANYVCEYGGIDELWFVVSPHNPFKKEVDLMDDDLRLELVRLATGDYPRFQVCDAEFHLTRPSYTIHTLDYLRGQHADIEFALLIGSDNWEKFPYWYEAERIMREYSVLIYPRPDYPIDASTLPANISLIEAPLFEISSTFIRQAMREGRDVRYFLHPAVYERLKA